MTAALEFGVPPADQIIPCCDAAAYSDGERCDCWVVVLTEPQQPLQEGPVAIRPKACTDCAYRMGSVERQRGEEPNPGGALIFCHWGAPEVVRAVHQPSGHTIEYAPGEVYDPIQHGDRYWRVDGQPQSYCAVAGALNRARVPVVSKTMDSGVDHG